MSTNATSSDQPEPKQDTRHDSSSNKDDKQQPDEWNKFVGWRYEDSHGCHL